MKAETINLILKNLGENGLLVDSNDGKPIANVIKSFIEKLKNATPDTGMAALSIETKIDLLSKLIEDIEQDQSYKTKTIGELKKENPSLIPAARSPQPAAINTCG